MPRTARASVGDVVFHVLNRGNGRAKVFHDAAEYTAFTELIGIACERLNMRVLAYCLMPNHIHLVLWPRQDGDLSRFMQWLLTAHVRRHHQRRGSGGHVWQGRFKAFPVQCDNYLLTVLRYVERNPVRAHLTRSAEVWPWSSAGLANRDRPSWLHPSPVTLPQRWLTWVNEPLTTAELASMRRSVNRGTPLGDPEWTQTTAMRLGIESSTRPRGRPRKAIATSAPDATATHK